MDPHEPFLKAILADRHDDLPRLVYADWLEETGEPPNVARAHFIRTQIHLENTDQNSRLYDDLKVVEGRFLTTYLDEWRWDLPDFARYWSAVEQVRWRRGFPDDLGEMNVRTFIDQGANALETLPLTSVHIRDRIAPIAFEQFPVLAHITTLKLGPSLAALMNPRTKEEETTTTFDSLLSAPVFTGLRHLDLSGNEIDDRWLLIFAARLPDASFDGTLESFDLSQNFSLTDASANVLATSAAFDGLKRLRLRDTRTTPAGISMLKKRFGDRLTNRVA